MRCFIERYVVFVNEQHHLPAEMHRQKVGEIEEKVFDGADVVGVLNVVFIEVALKKRFVFRRQFVAFQ